MYAEDTIHRSVLSHFVKDEIECAISFAKNIYTICQCSREAVLSFSKRAFVDTFEFIAINITERYVVNIILP